MLTSNSPVIAFKQLELFLHTWCQRIDMPDRIPNSAFYADKLPDGGNTYTQYRPRSTWRHGAEAMNRRYKAFNCNVIKYENRHIVFTFPGSRLTDKPLTVILLYLDSQLKLRVCENRHPLEELALISGKGFTVNRQIKREHVKPHHMKIIDQPKILCCALIRRSGLRAIFGALCQDSMTASPAFQGGKKAQDHSAKSTRRRSERYCRLISCRTSSPPLLQPAIIQAINYI